MKIIKILLFLFVISMVSLGTIGFESSHAAPQYIPGKYIVVLNENASDPTRIANEMENEHGFRVSHIFSHSIKGFTIHVQNENAISNIAKNPNVSFIEQDFVIEAFLQIIPTGIDRIDADLGETKSGDGTGIVDIDIAIIDTGIDLNHPDLNVFRNVSFVGTATGDDDHGHGSHVAGTAAALDNDIGVVGVAPGAKLWSIKVLNSEGYGTLSGIIDGIDYVTAHADEIDVVNLSLGCFCQTTAGDLAINNSIKAGVTYVVAAGNSADDAKYFWPASNPNVITVSALADSDGKCGSLGSSTSYGKDDSLATFSNYGNSVDIAAPGVDIYSTHKDGGYATYSGTSMASPHVAGSAALYISNNPNSSPAGAKSALIESGVGQSQQCDVSLSDGFGGFTGDVDFIPEPIVYISQKTIYDNSPVVEILNPTDDSTFDSEIFFDATAIDSEDGDITENLLWTSNIDGEISNTGSFSTSLSIGEHIITATVIDSAQNIGSSSIHLRIIAPSDVIPPVLIIPDDITKIQNGELTTLDIGTATATDNVDQNPIITNNSPTNGFPVGITTVTWSATDFTGNFATADQSITILANTDFDNDGILNQIDTSVLVFSNDFSDVSNGGTTTGSIINRGDQTLLIYDLENPKGVTIQSTNSVGDNTALVSACNGMSEYEISEGDEIIVTCGSVHVTIINGIVETSFFGLEYSGISTLSTGDSILFEFDFTLTNEGSNSVTIVVDEGEILVESGETITLGNDDVLPPSIIPPDDIVASSTGEFTQIDIGTATATDDFDPDPQITNDAPTNGFPLGTTVVTWNATDFTGNFATATQFIIIQSIPDEIYDDLESLKDIKPDGTQNVGEQVSEFVHIANQIFAKEREGIKLLQIEFRNSINEADPQERKLLREAFNLKLHSNIENLNEMKRQYHEIFTDYRNDVKELSHNSDGLTVTEKRVLREMDKVHSSLKLIQEKYDDSIMTLYSMSSAQEQRDVADTLKKIRTAIGHEEIKNDRKSDFKIFSLKQKEIESLKKKAFLEFDEKKTKLSQNEAKIKELEDEIKEFDTQIKEKEKQVKSDNNAAKSSNGKSSNGNSGNSNGNSGNSNGNSGGSSDSKSSDSKSKGKSESKSKGNSQSKKK